jgi:hypothetical protein
MPYRVPKAPAREGGALWVLSGATPFQLDNIGHHCPWRPTIQLGHHDGWLPILGSIYEKRLWRSPFVKNAFHKGQNKKKYTKNERVTTWATKFCFELFEGIGIQIKEV